MACVTMKNPPDLVRLRCAFDAYATFLAREPNAFYTHFLRGSAVNLVQLFKMKKILTKALSFR